MTADTVQLEAMNVRGGTVARWTASEDPTLLAFHVSGQLAALPSWCHMIMVPGVGLVTRDDERGLMRWMPTGGRKGKSWAQGAPVEAWATGGAAVLAAAINESRGLDVAAEVRS